MNNPYVRAAAIIPAASLAVADLATKSKAVTHLVTPREDSRTGRAVDWALDQVPLHNIWYGDAENAAMRNNAIDMQALNEAGCGGYQTPNEFAEDFNGIRQALTRNGNLTLPSDLAAQLEQIALPDPPAIYTLLGERIAQVRDTYSLAAEDLLAYLGNNDLAQLQAAGEALALADTVRAELVAAVAGLHSPRCREVWRDE